MCHLFMMKFGVVLLSEYIGNTWKYDRQCLKPNLQINISTWINSSDPLLHLLFGVILEAYASDFHLRDLINA